MRLFRPILFRPIMHNGKTEKKKLFKEYWLVNPRELHGTKAKHIEPGIVESMPKELNLRTSTVVRCCYRR